MKLTQKKPELQDKEGLLQTLDKFSDTEINVLLSLSLSQAVRFKFLSLVREKILPHMPS